MIVFPYAAAAAVYQISLHTRLHFQIKHVDTLYMIFFASKYTFFLVFFCVCTVGVCVHVRHIKCSVKALCVCVYMCVIILLCRAMFRFVFSKRLHVKSNDL